MRQNCLACSLACCKVKSFISLRALTSRRLKRLYLCAEYVFELWKGRGNKFREELTLIKQPSYCVLYFKSRSIIGNFNLNYWLKGTKKFLNSKFNIASTILNFHCSISGSIKFYVFFIDIIKSTKNWATLCAYNENNNCHFISIIWDKSY